MGLSVIQASAAWCISTHRVDAVHEMIQRSLRSEKKAFLSVRSTFLAIGQS